MKNVHLIAACGVGMASLAGMLREKGFRVTGSDANVYPADEHAAREPRHPALQPVRGGEHPGGRRPGGRRQRDLARQPGSGRGRPARPADALDAPGGGGIFHRGAGIDRRGRHAREDDHLIAGGVVPLRAGGRPVVPDRRRPAELPRELPDREGAALRHRGRRVRHRLFRQGAEVPPLPSEGRPADQHRVRPRRHLPGPLPCPRVVPQARGDPAARRAARRVRRLRGRRRGGGRGAVPGGLLRDAGRRAREGRRGRHEAGRSGGRGRPEG